MLGIDAAWTDRSPSGVALIRAGLDGLWKLVALAPSYESFVELAAGNPVRWQGPPTTSGPDPGTLLGAAERLLGGGRVTVVSVDMPLSRIDITGRREADNAVSREFGARGCGTHSPNRDRPGRVSRDFYRSLSRLGYRLAVNRPVAHALIEVYPAPALLCLLGRDYRVPYKVSRTLRYWPDLGRQERAEGIIREMKGIHEGLSRVIDGSLHSCLDCHIRARSVPSSAMRMPWIRWSAHGWEPDTSRGVQRHSVTTMRPSGCRHVGSLE